MGRFLIAYDLLKDERDYDGIHERIKALDPDWALGRVLESTWLVETDKRPEEIVRLLDTVGKERNDRFLVVSLASPWDGRRLRTESYLRQWLGRPSSDGGQ